jgi:hypothetical protein
MGMWDQANDCDSCGGGLRPWGELAPPNPAVALDEDHPMDVGNRWGILTGAGAPRSRRVPRVFAGLGDDGEDNPPVDTDSTSGSIDNSDNVDAAVNPTISPVTANPGETISASSTPVDLSGGGSSSNGGGGGSPSVTPSTPNGGTTNYAPWFIGGAIVLGAGMVGVAYYRRRLRRR